MSNIIKKILALILVASCTSGCLSPVCVYAEEQEEIYQDDIINEYVEDNLSSEESDDYDDADLVLEAESATLDIKEETEEKEVEDKETIIDEVVDEENFRLSQRHSKEYQFLRKFAIIEEDYRVDEIVTRGEFAAILTRMMGVSDGYARIFKDVFVRTANAKAIGIVCDYGLMSPDDSGYFRPKDSVTLEEAAKAFFTLAGYGPIVDIYGGEIEGYKRLASEAGMVNTNPDGTMTWDAMVKILYKALYIDVVDIGTISSIKSNTTYEMTSTKLLSMLYGLKEAKGRVMATEYAAVKGRTLTNKEEVVIATTKGDWIYSIGNTDIDDYLGYHVTFFYYTDDITDYTIATYIVNDKNTEVVEIKERDFDDINRSLTEISYSEKDKLKKAKLDNDATMIYNGAMCYDLTYVDFDNADFITLIDIDDDGSYEMCKITSYDVYWVKSVSPEHGVIEDKREGISLTVNDENYEVSIKKYGCDATLDMIEEWDILRVAVTKPNSNVDLMKIVVSTDISSGKVESKDTDDRIVILDGEEYYVSKSENMNDIFGNVIFGFDEDMKILCYIKDANVERKYGVIVKFYKDEDINETIHMYFMDENGDFITLPLAEKFIINNKRARWEDLCTLIGKNHDPDRYGDKAKPQMFAYILDTNGMIKRLYFAVDSSGEEVQSGAVDEAIENGLVLNKKFTSPRVWDRYGSINGEYLYTSNTKCFSIVLDSDGEIIKDLSRKFTMGQMRFSSATRFDNGARPSEMYCYDAGVERRCGAVLVKTLYSGLTSVSAEMKQVLIVDEVKLTLNSDDEVVDMIEGYYNGSKVELYVDDRQNIDVSTWERGDVFSIRYTVQGKLLSATKLFSLHDTSVLSPERDFNGKKPAITSGATYSETATVTSFAEAMNNAYGTIKSVENDSIRIRPEGGTEEVIYKFSATRVYVYDTDSNKIEISTTSDITSGMGTGKAFIYARYGLARDVFIIK